MGPYSVVLCREHAKARFQAQRRRECAAILRTYGDLSARMEQARAHYIALRAMAAGNDPEVNLFLAAAEQCALRYLAEFPDQAWRTVARNGDRAKGTHHAQRARARGGYRLPIDVPWLRRVWRHECALCGTKDTRAHLDHLYPLAAGGEDTPWNVAPICAAENLSKGARPLWDWLPGWLAALDPVTRTAVTHRWCRRRDERTAVDHP
ncbi:hypothetical protein GCM10012275_19110 [Longimycelium tulufanense]|uniref:HNH domain-containing protein n=1 Tax=Longimycelium tulufanense TaxID=907463 RepID=A0A8J3CCP4_9PSEU|nr:hypothetical protein GCM10012275_19110 [Longimycelium tulufanense]